MCTIQTWNRITQQPGNMQVCIESALDPPTLWRLGPTRRSLSFSFLCLTRSGVTWRSRAIGSTCKRFRRRLRRFKDAKMPV
ncbi:hypothetical protein JG688_00009997 [Phytophthora aleatoria]|uniref:Uncharacterized protein n=1 Tax=Phytophthora aleatoria TaxID=2496075 RepID=A0A8J5J2Q5_9STRA|nr:hypothetical protein JG688_00009997 [Phytophthora aleatoria]